MKGLIFLLAFSLALTFSVSAQDKVLTADEVLKPVYAKAAKEKKNVLIIFHASWCGWCHKMDTALNDREIQSLINKHYEVAHLTVYESPNKRHLENPGALELLTKHSGADKGLPYWFIFDHTGKLLANADYAPGENTGCPASEEEVAYFISVLKKTSSLKDAELAIIQKRFRQNAD